MARWSAKRLKMTEKAFLYLKIRVYVKQHGSCYFCHQIAKFDELELHHLAGIRNNSPYWVILVHDLCHAKIDEYRNRTIPNYRKIALREKEIDRKVEELIELGMQKEDAKRCINREIIEGREE